MYFSNDSKTIDDFFSAMSELIDKKQVQKEKEVIVRAARSDFERHFYQAFSEQLDKTNDDDTAAGSTK